MLRTAAPALAALAASSAATLVWGQPPDLAPTSVRTRTFSDVTPAILSCMRERSRKQHGTTFVRDPNNPNSGTSETHYYGLTRLSYAFDPALAAVTYTILQKPGLASNGQVWDGVRAAIKACS